MTRSTNMLTIDGSRLRKELSKRNLVANDISEEMGLNRTYLTKCVNTNLIGKPASVMLKKIYDIDFEDYKVLPKEPATAIVENKLPEDSIAYLSAEELSTLMYKAVYAAISHAWNEPYTTENGKKEA